MRIWLNLALPLSSLLLSPQWTPADSEALDRELAILEYRLELARGPEAHIEIRPDCVTALVKGIPVKKFPVRHSGFPSHTTPRLSHVASILPPAPVLRVVVRLDQGSPSDTVSALEDIVSVEDMPDTFSITLADGSLLHVTSNPGRAYRLLADPVNFHVLYMDRAPAQHLFWILKAGMRVVY